MIQSIIQSTSLLTRNGFSGTVVTTMNSIMTTRTTATATAATITTSRISIPASSSHMHQPHRLVTTRSFATGSRGSRGYGWFYHYREGKGGRHLQGEYHDRDSMEQCMAWNQSILDLGSQRIYMDIIAEPRRNLNSSSSSSSNMNSNSSDNHATAGSSSSTTTPLSSMRNNPKKFFTIPPADTLKGETHRIVIDIASTVLPATCDNFINLIQAKNTTTDNDSSENTPTGYRGTRLYRIEKDVGIYGGDVLTNTGRTGMAYNAVALTKDVSDTDPIPMWHIPGTITMIVPTVNEIDSRFLLCTQHAPHIDGICRPFGMITSDSLTILQKWQTNLLTLKGGIPNAFDLYVVDCGVLLPNNVDKSHDHDTKVMQSQQMQQ